MIYLLFFYLLLLLLVYYFIVIIEFSVSIKEIGDWYIISMISLNVTLVFDLQNLFRFKVVPIQKKIVIILLKPDSVWQLIEPAVTQQQNSRYWTRWQDESSDRVCRHNSNRKRSRTALNSGSPNGSCFRITDPGPAGRIFVHGRFVFDCTVQLNSLRQRRRCRGRNTVRQSGTTQHSPHASTQFRNQERYFYIT